MSAKEYAGRTSKIRAWAFINALWCEWKGSSYRKSEAYKESKAELGKIEIKSNNPKVGSKSKLVLTVSASRKALSSLINHHSKEILDKNKIEFKCDSGSTDHLNYLYNIHLSKGPLQILKDFREDKLSKDYLFKITLWSSQLADNERHFNDEWEVGKEGKKSKQEGKRKSNSITCPYIGLSTYSKENAKYFFGRNNFISTLEEAVKNKPLVSVVGNSGVGKSSVVFAGLFPKLSENEWKIASFRPKNDPFYELANAFVELFESQNIKEDNQNKLVENLKNQLYKEGFDNLKEYLENKLDSEFRYLLFIDQFEELYTPYTKEGDNHKFLEVTNHFLDLLSEIINLKKLTIVITLRADFYQYPLNHPNFGRALQEYKVENLLRMNRDELKEAIEKPLKKAIEESNKVIEEPVKRVNIKFENGLIDTLLDDMENSQGDLCLLQFTLEKLWEKCSNKGMLTLAAYRYIKKIKNALAKHAEDVFKKLDINEEQAKYIFTQLVHYGEDTGNARRIANFEQIGKENWGLVTLLAGKDARLVVISYDYSTKQATVELVHEALIREWKMLRKWMLEERDFRIWQDRLRLNIKIWEEKDFDNNFLLRGASLSEAKKWMNSIKDTKEIVFIEASLRYQREQDIDSIETLIKFSEIQFQNKQELSSLAIAVEAGTKLKEIELSYPKYPCDEELKGKLIERLQQSTYAINEQNQLDGHTNEVCGVVFSPDGETIASASDDSTIKLWDLEGNLLRIFEGHTNNAYQVCFSPDGKKIASSSADFTVKLWSVENGELLKTMEHPDRVWGVCFSPDGTKIASACIDKSVRIWNSNDGKLLQCLEGHTERVWGVCFSPDGSKIASGSGDKSVRIWNSDDGKLLQCLEGHDGEVWGVCFSPDGTKIASAGLDGRVKLWELDGTILKQTLFKNLEGNENHAEILGISFFNPPDSLNLNSPKIAAACIDGTIKLWNLDGSPSKIFHGHIDRVWGVCFSPDGKMIASAGADSQIRLWHIRDEVNILQGHNQRVWGVCFSPDGKKIASTSLNEPVKLWNLDGTSKNLEENSTGNYGACYSHDSKRIATAGYDNVIRLWSDDGIFLKKLEGHNGHVMAVCFSYDDSLIASASLDKTVRLWCIDRNLEIKTLPHDDQVWGVNFSPDGKMIASACSDRKVRLWDSDGCLLNELVHQDRVQAVSFSPDGKMIASASLDGTVKLWDVEGNLQNKLTGHTRGVNGVCFDPEGKMIASASVDRTVRLWSIEGVLLRTFAGHTDQVVEVCFSSDSKTIASASFDKTIRLWRVDDKDLVSDLDIKLENLLVNGRDWIRNYVTTNQKIKNDCKKYGI